MPILPKCRQGSIFKPKSKTNEKATFPRSNSHDVVFLQIGKIRSCGNYQNRISGQPYPGLGCPLRFCLCVRYRRHGDFGTIQISLQKPHCQRFSLCQRHHPHSLSGRSRQTNKNAPFKLSKLPNPVRTNFAIFVATVRNYCIFEVEIPTQIRFDVK